MSQYVILMGYFIPPQGECGGPRAASRCVCKEEDIDSQIAGALAYLERCSFECAIVEAVPWDEFLPDMKQRFDDLKARVLEEWRAENPEKAYRDEPPPPDADQIASNFTSFLGTPRTRGR